ncbi:hypothetical protein NDU88_001616 [Pleurodeles waltl]|uniref:Uncharacterized protein n=1 Tax=Pleurodeles waltl TaxID=8319 RepID=A0AAV7KT45_PLEWA|nr:hypothetical protein NDU88_001616 [Pleurodeles waltl]
MRPAPRLLVRCREGRGHGRRSAESRQEREQLRGQVRGTGECRQSRQRCSGRSTRGIGERGSGDQEQVRQRGYGTPFVANCQRLLNGAQKKTTEPRAGLKHRLSLYSVRAGRTPCRNFAHNI